MKCPICTSKLLRLYYRKGAQGKQWITLKNKLYCESCDKVIQTPSPIVNMKKLTEKEKEDFITFCSKVLKDSQEPKC